jgi:hypothetical protein
MAPCPLVHSCRRVCCRERGSKLGDGGVGVDGGAFAKLAPSAHVALAAAQHCERRVPGAIGEPTSSRRSSSSGRRSTRRRQLQSMSCAANASERVNASLARRTGPGSQRCWRARPGESWTKGVTLAAMRVVAGLVIALGLMGCGGGGTGVGTGGATDAGDEGQYTSCTTPGGACPPRSGLQTPGDASVDGADGGHDAGSDGWNCQVPYQGGDSSPPPICPI